VKGPGLNVVIRAATELQSVFRAVIHIPVLAFHTVTSGVFPQITSVAGPFARQGFILIVSNKEKAVEHMIFYFFVSGV